MIVHMDIEGIMLSGTMGTLPCSQVYGIPKRTSGRSQSKADKVQSGELNKSMDFLVNLLLLPYTLLMWGFKYAIAIGLWYLLFNKIYQDVSDVDWKDWWYSSKGSVPTLWPWKRKKTNKQYGDDPEDYIV